MSDARDTATEENLPVSTPAVAVFVGNKLISTDTILPVMMELSVRKHVSDIRFYCVDAPTYTALQKNVVLRDGIETIGTLRFIGARSKTGFGRLRHRLAVLPLMAGLAIRALLGQLTIVHFGIVNARPFRWLFRLNRGATVYVQGASTGYRATERQFDDIKQERKRATNPIAAKTLVGFQADWEVLERPEAKRLPRYILRPTQLAPAWRNFVAEHAHAYFAAEFERAGHAPSAEALVFVLGYLGDLDFIRDGTSMVDLFEETLDMLIERSEGRPIFVKPHAITEMELLDGLIAARAEAPIIVCHLHPAVLATRAKLFIANYYSGALGTARLMGVPTIEYTDYSDDALAVTSNRSVRDDHIDHFILRDPGALHAAITAALAKPAAEGPPGQSSIDEGLLSALAGHDASIVATAEPISGTQRRVG